MIERALAAKTPFGWVAADSVYGVGNLETTLRQAGKGYVLGVSSDHRVNSWGKARPIAGTVGSVAQGLSPSDWVRLSAGEGTKGARFYDWAYPYHRVVNMETSASGHRAASASQIKIATAMLGA
jgi:SRSO17 transposase